MAGSKEVGNTANVTEEQAQAVFKAVKTLTEIVGEKVTIMGFGTFRTVTKAARSGRNPQTGETILVPAKTVLTFKAAKPAKPKK